MLMPGVLFSSAASTTSCLRYCSVELSDETKIFSNSDDFETTLGSRYSHKGEGGLGIRTQPGSRYPSCKDKICTPSESRKGVSVTVLVRIPRP